LAVDDARLVHAPTSDTVVGKLTGNGALGRDSVLTRACGLRLHHLATLDRLVVGRLGAVAARLLGHLGGGVPSGRLRHSVIISGIKRITITVRNKLKHDDDPPNDANA
jgi:hypothetical protein